MANNVDSLPSPTWFAGRAAGMGIAFDPGDVEKLGLYIALLLDANSRFNLTSITNHGEAWNRHVLDSLSLVSYLTSADAKRVIDVGSGGGLPGIPLAIVLPEVQVTLLESTGKKTRFLEDVVSVLGLDNVVVVNDRAEYIGRDIENHREMYDIVTARAVGSLSVLLELTIPLASIGGHVLAIKGKRAKKEIEQAKAALHKLHSVVVSSNQSSTGTIVLIKKQRKTPKIYPRRTGEPKREPLS